MARYPLAFGHALTAGDMAVYGATEVAIVGDPGAPDFQALARELSARYVPSLVLAGGEPSLVLAGGVELLKDRGARDGGPTAYVCKGYACDQPTSDPAGLARQLEAIILPTASP
jgi:hypothetical protein